MPIVQVTLLEGRSLDDKRVLVRGLTDVMVEALGVRPESVQVHLVERAREDVGIGGDLVLDRGGVHTS